MRSSNLMRSCRADFDDSVSVQHMAGSMAHVVVFSADEFHFSGEVVSKRLFIRNCVFMRLHPPGLQNCQL